MSLEMLCAELGIETRELTESSLDEYRDKHPKKEALLKVMARLTELAEGEIMMIGGLCVIPELLGARDLRRPSNDLDCVATKKGITDVVNGMELNNCFRTTNYGDLFFDVEGIPCSVDMEQTHGWAIPGEF